MTTVNVASGAGTYASSITLTPGAAIPAGQLCILTNRNTAGAAISSIVGQGTWVLEAFEALSSLYAEIYSVYATGGSGTIVPHVGFNTFWQVDVAYETGLVTSGTVSDTTGGVSGINGTSIALSLTTTPGKKLWIVNAGDFLAATTTDAITGYVPFTDGAAPTQVPASAKVVASSSGTETVGYGIGYNAFVLVGAAINMASGGTTFTKSLSGSITPTGIIIRSTLRILIGSITPVGIIIRQTLRTLIASISPSGVLQYQVNRLLNGSITPSGTLSAFTLKSKSLSGSITPTGNVIKLTLRLLIGSITPTGTLIRETFRLLTGLITPVGTVTTPGRLSILLTASLTPVGNLIKSTSRLLTGSITPSGILTAIKNPIIVVSTIISTWWQKRHRRY